METINLSIFSCDNDYSLALGEALSISKNNFIITVCKDERELSDICDFDLLVLDSESAEMNEKFKEDRRVIKLAESCSDVVKNMESMIFVLYKYSDVQELASDILLYYSLLTGKRNFSWPDAKSKIISFCGAKGGVGKTTVAFGVGQALRRYYSKSVLYLSMEEIESTLLYMKGREDGLDLCAYLYYLFKADGKKPDNEAFMIHDKFGMSAFMPDRGTNKLRELDAEKMALFFKEISESGKYDYVLVDMGESFSEEMKWIFNICDKIIVVSLSGASEDEREKRFINYLNFVTGEKQDDNLMIVHNKATDRENAADDDGRIYIDFDADSIDRSGEILEISIDQDFGTGIKNVAKKTF